MNNKSNLYKSITKYMKQNEEFETAAINGTLSPYHLKEKTKALESSRKKILSMLGDEPEGQTTEVTFSEVIEKDGRKLKQVAKTMLTPERMHIFIGKNLEVWTKPPHLIRLAYQVFKPLEFREEYETIIAQSENGCLIYEEVMD